MVARNSHTVHGAKARVTQDRLKDVLNYEPETGIFTWRLRIGRSVVGTNAGFVDTSGYIGIAIDGVKYRGHRLAFFYMTGRWPNPECDHADLNKTNNRWLNLREASQHQNNANKKLTSRNTSGYKGVSFYSRTGKWRARLRGIDLGLFQTKEEAFARYTEEALSHYKEFARCDFDTASA